MLLLVITENSNEGKMYEGRSIWNGIEIPFKIEYLINPGYCNDEKNIFVELLYSILNLLFRVIFSCPYIV